MEKLDPSDMCTDASIVEQYKRDPLVNKGHLSARVGSEFLTNIDRTLDAASELITPILIVHGTNDKICDIRGSERFLHVARTPDKRLEALHEGKHEILNEPNWKATMSEKIIPWIVGHTN